MTAKPLHLVGRFLGMLAPVGPRPARRRWAESQLTDEERALFRRLRPADRRHAVAVARRVERRLGDETTRPVLAAALLHDIGKLDSHLGVYGRTVATLCGFAVRHDEETIREWTRTRGITRRIGLYLRHARLGGDVLELAGSEPVVVAWAREHHLPREEWTVPPAIGDVLKSCDGD